MKNQYNPKYDSEYTTETRKIIPSGFCVFTDVVTGVSTLSRFRGIGYPPLCLRGLRPDVLVQNQAVFLLFLIA